MQYLLHHVSGAGKIAHSHDENVTTKVIGTVDDETGAGGSQPRHFSSSMIQAEHSAATIAEAATIARNNSAQPAARCSGAAFSISW